MKKYSYVDVINLVLSSGRPMPAHFCSFKDRTQSFCIDCDFIDADDEYNLASDCWYNIKPKKEDDLDHTSLMMLMKCGEDLAIASYLAVKTDNQKDLNEIVKVLIRLNKESWPKHLNANKLFQTQSAKEYFDYCTARGVATANN